MLDAVKRTLKAKEVYFLENVGFKTLTTIKCGGIAPIVVYPRTLDEFIFVIRYLTHENVCFRVIGNMSNVLPTDGVYDGVIVKTTFLNRKELNRNVVTAECGIKISNLLWHCARLNFGGGEGLFMIPGTLGGMVYGNAGAYGVAISDIFLDAAFYDAQEDKIITIEKSDMQFSYRHSVVSSGQLYMLYARISLRALPFDIIRARISEFAKMRRASQPTSYPSLGSVFRREAGVIPARIIDELGLKGMSVGGAMVSRKHAGFIINYNNATSRDVRELIEKIKNTVTDRLSLCLKCEIEYL